MALFQLLLLGILENPDFADNKNYIACLFPYCLFITLIYVTSSSGKLHSVDKKNPSWPKDLRTFKCQSSSWVSWMSEKRSDRIVPGDSLPANPRAAQTTAPCSFTICYFWQGFSQVLKCKCDCKNLPFISNFPSKPGLSVRPYSSVECNPLLSSLKLEKHLQERFYVMYVLY